MQRIVYLLTSLVFAAHALLGCAAHRTCGHRTAVFTGQPENHADRDCAAHYASHGNEPGEDRHQSPETCWHSACSYVKAETPRVDVSANWAASWAVLGPVEKGQADAWAADVGEPVHRVDFSSAQLYVWHCALII